MSDVLCRMWGDLRQRCPMSYVEWGVACSVSMGSNSHHNASFLTPTHGSTHCIYVCVCLYLRVCMFVFTCVYVCIYVCVCLYLRVCMFVYMCVCVRVYVRCAPNTCELGISKRLAPMWSRLVKVFAARTSASDLFFFLRPLVPLLLLFLRLSSFSSRFLCSLVPLCAVFKPFVCVFRWLKSTKVDKTTQVLTRMVGSFFHYICDLSLDLLSDNHPTPPLPLPHLLLIDALPLPLLLLIDALPSSVFFFVGAFVDERVWGAFGRLAPFQVDSIADEVQTHVSTLPLEVWFVCPRTPLSALFVWLIRTGWVARSDRSGSVPRCAGRTEEAKDGGADVGVGARVDLRTEAEAEAWEGEGGWGAVRCGAVRCGAVRCGAVRCGAVRVAQWRIAEVVSCRACVCVA